ncbi:hypothetical protein H7I42_29795 [Mycolicibacterium vanbaalenii PYR-1]|nr:hypothetical protein [Mycolicibacterium vanbaalenii]MCV7131012.1 hypothetical protein [Mycolicibacterium vanbaalenii PYR-1]
MASRAIAARNKLGNACRHNRDPLEITAAKQELAAAKIADNVEKVLSQAPPLTDDQIRAIAALLRTGGASS